MGGVRLFRGYWGLVLSVLVACGGRAVVDSDQGIDPHGSIAGGASDSEPSPVGATSETAGAPSPSVDGNPSATSATDVACSKYCSALARYVCTFEAGDECTQSCSEELGRQAQLCQNAATFLIDCLMASYLDSQDCSTAEQMARNECAIRLTAYQNCVASQPVVRSPYVEPSQSATPPALRPPISAGCTASGSSSSRDCRLSLECNGRSYHISCDQNPDGQTSCVCGSTAFILDQSVSSACTNGIRNCGP